MTGTQRAELRDHARKVAAEAPPLPDEMSERLAVLLQPAIQPSPVPASKAA